MSQSLNETYFEMGERLAMLDPYAQYLARVGWFINQALTELNYKISEAIGYAWEQLPNEVNEISIEQAFGITAIMIYEIKYGSISEYHPGDGFYDDMVKLYKSNMLDEAATRQKRDPG